MGRNSRLLWRKDEWASEGGLPNVLAVAATSIRKSVPLPWAMPVDQAMDHVNGPCRLISRPVFP